VILGFIVSNKGKIPNPKMVQAIVNMPVLTNPHQIQIFNGMAQFYRCFIKNFAFIMAPITKLMRKKNLLSGPLNVKKLRIRSSRSTWKTQF
jgi:hypothetical protein